MYSTWPSFGFHALLWYQCVSNLELLFFDLRRNDLSIIWAITETYNQKYFRKGYEHLEIALLTTTTLELHGSARNTIQIYVQLILVQDDQIQCKLIGNKFYTLQSYTFRFRITTRRANFIECALASSLDPHNRSADALLAREIMPHLLLNRLRYV